MKEAIQFFFFFCVLISAQAQDNSSYRFAFYNFENLFDTKDDSLTRDEEFTPEGARHWTNYKYYKKLDQLARVISVIGGWESIDVLAFCEVENKECIEDLLNRKALRNENFGIAYAQSQDRRGIDLGLIYNKSKFKLVVEENIRLKSDELPGFRTRDILHAVLVDKSKDSFHVFVNHWPSKYGGKLESENLRMLASKTLAAAVNKTVVETPKAKIICLGDFNDEAFEKSIENLEKNTDLINISSRFNSSMGTHKYQGNWAVIDQLFVSPELENKFLLKPEIYKAEFLLTDDEKFLGKKPSRTFIGFSYNSEGYSDHLPIILQLTKREL